MITVIPKRSCCSVSGDASVLFQVWCLVSWATWYVAIALHLSEELGGCVLWSSDVAVVGYLCDWVVDLEGIAVHDGYVACYGIDEDVSFVHVADQVIVLV